jgi:hypothetical protein
LSEGRQKYIADDDDDAIGGWRKLHIEELQNLYCHQISSSSSSSLLAKQSFFIHSLFY